MYEPKDDSFLLNKVVKEYLKDRPDLDKIRVLDLGSGSGIQAKNCISTGVKKENIVSVDIDKNVLEEVGKLGVEVINSDLYSNVKGRFDLIIFNAPYLPEHEFDKGVDTTGGERGDEAIIRFLQGLKEYLSYSGVGFFVSSSHTPEWRFLDLCGELGLRVQKIDSKKVFFEEIYVWKVWV